MKNFRIEAIIIAVALCVIGLFFYFGVTQAASAKRTVSVRGLSERDFPADQVSWPLVYKLIGNDLQNLYDEMTRTNTIIVKFLQDNGIESSEINVNAPEIVDMNAERYGENNRPYRYNFTTVILVNSNKVDLVRDLINKQADLLKKGVALSGDEYQYRVQYNFTRLNEVKPEMIEEATKNAREAAEKFASDSDSKIGKILHAYQGQFSIENRDESTPYIKHVRVVTTIDYALKD